jgi:hypothetical protein
MNARTICFWTFNALFAVVGAAVLMAVVLDIVSVPNPKTIAIHYHRHLASE